MFYLNLIIFNLIFIFSVNVVLSKNPIKSVIYLIGVFFLSFFILLSLNLSFFALIILIIYIGAIAVLFLFIVMMLNFNLIENFEQPTVFSFSLFFLLLFIILNFNNIENIVYINYYYIIYFFNYFEIEQTILNLIQRNYFNIELNNTYILLEVIEFYILENSFLLFFVGLMLTFSLVGVVDLITRNRLIKNTKSQEIFEQVNRSINNSIIYLE